MARSRGPLFEGSDWSFEVLERCYAAIEDVAANDLGLDTYPNQIEIISAEQMLDAHSSIGMPLMYRHWSFGKHFARHEKLYRKGYVGLAHEIVINSNPCISYNIETNPMAMHVVVMAHAAFGHNHFFKNNYLFQQWTDAEGILDYLEYAKAFIERCEERHGVRDVERVLDTAHALMDHGVFRYRHPPDLNARERETRTRERREHEERTFNDLWRTVPRPDTDGGEDASERDRAERTGELNLPEENLIYFIEKNSPILEPWQREVLRIVRTIAQYFYPQRQTRLMNEGCATFVHLYVANALFDRGLLTEGAMLEILHNHANLVLQPDFDDPRYSGINVYALGLAMMEDIKRMCEAPTEEDRAWFPELAGRGDWRDTLRHAWANYRDESFVRQYLSPRVIRRFRLFALIDDAAETSLTVSNIHDEPGYRGIREAVARSYDLGANEPDIQIIDADLRGDRHLRLEHSMRDGIPLAVRSRDMVLNQVRALWGYDVSLTGVDKASGGKHYLANALQPAEAS